MQPQEINKISNLLPFLSAVSERDWQQAEIITINPSFEHSIREGHIFQHAIFVMKGILRVYKISDQGREITLYRVHSGQSCVLMMASILGESEYEAMAAIEVESEVLMIPVEAFRIWMDTYKPLRQFIYKQMIQRITAVSKLLENIAFYPIQYRLADFLLKNTTEDRVILKMTHESISIELGTAREVISRTLKDFQDKGIVSLHRGGIALKDRVMLGKLIN